MKTMLVRFIVAFAVVCVYSAPAGALDRTWLKYHQSIVMDQVLFAEYTTIQTNDQGSPASQRFLYKDDHAVPLVIRYDTPFTTGGGSLTATSTQMSVTKADTAEQLTIAVSGDGSTLVTITIGTGSMAFTDQDPVPVPVRQSAMQLLQANASQSFQDALRRFAVVATSYTTAHGSLGFALRGLFFPDINVATPQDYTTDATDVVRDFDPNTNPPGAFEQPFGQAYYQ